MSNSSLSSFELKVLEALTPHDEVGSVLRKQVQNSVIIERDYTGVGLYSNFSVHPSAPRLSTSSRHIESMPLVHLEHPNLVAGAGAMLWFSEGYISTLECYTYEGEWPSNEDEFTVHLNHIGT